MAAQQTPPASDSTKAPPKPPDRWAAAVDLGFQGSSGNSRLMVLSTGFRLRHLETKSFKLEWSVGLRYGESKGEVVARNLQSSINFNLYPQALWSPFAFATFERDPFRLLALRSNTGSGLTYALRSGNNEEVTVSAAALYSHENFTVNTTPDKEDARWSVQAHVLQKIGSSVQVENSSSWKPVWNHGGDYNVQTLTKLSTKVTQRLAMTFSHEYLRDSTPPEGVKRDDQRVQAGLTIAF